MPKTTYLADFVLDTVLGGTTFTQPATVYIALFTVTPTIAGTGGTEVSGGSYARATVTNNGTNWTTAAAGSKNNATAITFATPTAGWGTVISFGIYDALTSGNLLYFGTLSTAKPITTGDTVSFQSGTLVVTEA